MLDDQALRSELYPDITPYAHGTLAVGERHEIYWEQSGHPDGVPVVFLHGGPGAGANALHRRFFDPQHYRIVVFDQRGAGRSRPFAEVRDNTTPHLLADMERLREHLEIERWIVFGGSWGATLGLAYGIAHPERCLGFVLRGVFLGRRREVTWFLEGAKAVFPEAWRDFAAAIPEDERGDLLAAYHRRLMHRDQAVHLAAARAWARYENACSVLVPQGIAAAAAGAAPLSLARIECHYFVNDCFLPPDHILQNIGRLRERPATIVQGRYDMVCPIATADELARAWPEADYVVVPDAGHSAMETGIRHALVRAMERLKRDLPGQD